MMTTRIQSSNESEGSRLLTLHQAALEAHLKSDVDSLLKDESDDYVLANRGEISHPDKKARQQRLKPYLQATTFTVYRDVVPPIVNVSPDGMLGWVVAQVYAQGTQTTADGEMRPIEFVSAWIELYEKRNGRWRRTGNVSNFRP